MKMRKSSGSLLQLALAVCLLVLLSLLIGNVALIMLAINLNDSTCRQAAQAGAETYLLGGNQQDLQISVFHAVNKDITGGFFISHPALEELKCYSDSNGKTKKQMLLVKTVTVVRVPAPFLLFFAHPVSKGRLLLSSACLVELKADLNVLPNKS